VRIGCGGHYEWLAYLLQYNPLVTIKSSIEFVDTPGTYNSHEFNTVDPFEDRPTPEYLVTTHSIPNVSAGDQLDFTCRIQFHFTHRGYSPRNNYMYALNTLTWDCTVKETVRCMYIRLV